MMGRWSAWVPVISSLMLVAAILVFFAAFLVHMATVQAGSITIQDARNIYPPRCHPALEIRDTKQRLDALAECVQGLYESK